MGTVNEYRVKLFIGNVMREFKTVTGQSTTFPDVSTTTYYQIRVTAYTAPVNGLGGGYGPEVSTGMVVQTKPECKSHRILDYIFSVSTL